MEMPFSEYLLIPLYFPLTNTFIEQAFIIQAPGKLTSYEETVKGRHTPYPEELMFWGSNVVKYWLPGRRLWVYCQKQKVSIGTQEEVNLLTRSACFSISDVLFLRIEVEESSMLPSTF